MGRENGESRVLTEHQSGGKLVWVDLYNPTNEEIAQAAWVRGWGPTTCG